MLLFAVTLSNDVKPNTWERHPHARKAVVMAEAPQLDISVIKIKSRIVVPSNGSNAQGASEGVKELTRDGVHEVCSDGVEIRVLDAPQNGGGDDDARQSGRGGGGCGDGHYGGRLRDQLVAGVENPYQNIHWHCFGAVIN